MSTAKKQATYTTTNSYETLNTITPNTKNIWIVLHGIGYLSRYFIRYFETLPTDKNYIIAPQAPSKYYLKDNYKRVGASWLTKEDTNIEIQNTLNYLDQIYQQEGISSKHNIIIFGYSQGVSIASRWVGLRKILCDHLVLYSGGIPNELKQKDFQYLLDQNSKITCIVGDKDEYISETNRKKEFAKINHLFQEKASQVLFDGGHEVKKEIIASILD
ncbi:esterase [uncultured Maribacter sp.]|uniref:alpha/beta hydrolase n=1 Tax=uncultured Maribacter sp. TaxID=431308 RepID=UPI0026145DA2|nr:esterase [uncultured Maribacter sp.]